MSKPSLWSRIDSAPQMKGVPVELTYLLALICEDRPDITNQEIAALLDKVGIPVPEALDL